MALEGGKGEQAEGGEEEKEKKGLLARIGALARSMQRVEEDIIVEAEAMKNNYARAAGALPEGQSYFLNGIQNSSVVKAYLLTRAGVEVLGEGTVPVAEFIDSVLRFAAYPRRKIEVLQDLAVHLQNVNKLTNSLQQAQ